MEGNLHSQSIGLAFFLERNLLFFCFTLYYGTIFFFGGAYTWRGGLFSEFHGIYAVYCTVELVVFK